ncbi:DUF4097 family beta strand repeat-containing protein [Saccharopolyspora sp. SCSIO 74807]|uniref:DUF4097 family beta strand repeat-containing protein n=1 Tax=Saccharopolyspora sp. SCSIO 74807 TaxID=3118084 RepID=UPI0030D44EF7
MNSDTGRNSQPGDSQPGDAESREPNELVRTQEFDTPGPIVVDVGNSLGAINVELAETVTTHVEIRHDSAGGGPEWRTGLSGLLNWVGGQISEAGRRGGLGAGGLGAGGFGGGLGDRAFGDRGPGEPIAEAVRQTTIDFTGGNRLSVRAPSTVPLRTVPLAITVRAPEETEVSVRSTGGDVRVTGPASRARVESGGGAVSVERAGGNAVARTGSGALRLGEMGAGVQARSGGGDVEIASVGAASSVVTGSGSVWLGAVHADVLVRSGSGDITISEAARGQTELITGSGELRVAVRRGVTAEVDLTSTTGSAHSDLEVSAEPAEDEPPLRIFGRTGSGDALLTSAG